MRKILVCAVALLLAVLLCACGKNEERPMSEEIGRESAENVGGAEETAAVEPEETAAAEPEETAAVEPEEVEFGNEDDTDAPSEEKRESWNPRSVRHLRASRDKESFRSAIRQGNMIYLAFEDRLAKMPVGGNADDVEVLLDWDFTGSNEILEIQVVGEWIYIRTDEEVGSYYYNVNSLWRIRTDGTGLERIANIMAADDRKRNTFAVIGDRLYLSCMASERRSASETCFTSTLYCYQLDTGAVTELYQTSSTEADTNLFIFTYNEKSLILMDYTQNKYRPVLLIYEYGAAAPVVAPEAVQELMIKMANLKKPRYFFYDDMTETGSYLAEYDETLYRISPEKGYLPEELPIQLFTAEEATDFEDNRRIKELLVLDEETYVYSYWVLGLGFGLRLYQNGTLTDINGDFGECLNYPGDGYLYYAFRDNYYHHYRVRLDGTGWEQLDWEHRSYPTADSYE